LAQPSGEGQWGSASDAGAEYRTLGIKGVHANPGPYLGDTSVVVGGNGQQRGAMAVAAGMFVLMLYVIILLFCRYFVVIVSLFVVLVVTLPCNFNSIFHIMVPLAHFTIVVIFPSSFSLMLVYIVALCVLIIGPSQVSIGHNLHTTSSQLWTPHEIHIQRQVQRRGGELYVLTAAGKNIYCFTYCS